ncbi:MAG: gliding motility-associated C-terminal domain-containing protein [Saprospiraceae bacterium]|nr:gliding motility-associated C-terminal domain-containing protein [Saprospiraceae bacterium]
MNLIFSLLRCRTIIIIVSLLFSEHLNAQVKCCCGTPQEMNFQGLDFEFGPDPAPSSFIPYGVGTMGPWIVTRGYVDHVDKDHFFGSSYGNPNGPSNFVDLYGSPGGGSPPGTISYLLTGLTAGYIYTIEFYYAVFNLPGNYSANLKVANGAWLNVNWTATNPGNVIWLKASYIFTAAATSANLEFTDTGGTTSYGQIGMLIDDIKIFECPVDTMMPQILNEPVDEEYGCLKDVPNLPVLEITDNCDPNPNIQFSTNTQKINDCEQLITRNWIVTDGCGNKKNHSQLITVKDEDSPYFVTKATDFIVDCKLHSRNEFLRWISLSGGAVLLDNCSNVSIQSYYDSIPSRPCDSMLVDFIATDDCGNETPYQAFYIITDTIPPIISKKPENVLLKCSSTARDSLKSWLLNHGNAIASDECGELTWTNDFKADSSELDIEVNFIATDRCGNKNSSKANFKRTDGADTTRSMRYICDRSSMRLDTALYTLPGCDSVVIITSIGIAPDTITIQQNTCDHLHPTRIVEQHLSQYGCDSVIVQIFNYIKPDTTFAFQFDCQINDTVQQISIFSGQFCDSVNIQFSVPAKSSMTKEFVLTCDSNEVRIDSLKGYNQFGCDSLHLTEYVYSGFRIFFKDSAVCGLSKEFYDTLTIRQNPCDSIVVTHFISLRKDTTQINSSTCDPKQAGNFQRTYKNQFACDSVIFESIIFQKSDTTSGIAFVCNIQEVRIDTHYIGRPNLCDSVHILQYNYLAPDTTLLKSFTCDSMEAGKTITQLNGQICDSIIIHDKILLPNYLLSFNRSTCFIDSLQADTSFLQTHLGCDSIVVTNKIYKPLDFLSQTKDISCFGKNDGLIQIFPDTQFLAPFKIFLNDVETNQTVLSSLVRGNYKIRIQDQQGCLSVEKNFILSEPNLLTVDIGPDLQVKKSENIQFTANSNRKVLEWEWQPANSFQCPNCEISHASFNEETLVSLWVRDSNGCEAVDSLLVYFIEDPSVFVPNGFSPNGDGVNDYFYVFGDESSNVESMLIFDRWGEQVFAAYNVPVNIPTNGWDGRFLGQWVLPGVYVYLIKLIKPDGSVLVLNGDISVIR